MSAFIDGREAEIGAAVARAAALIGAARLPLIGGLGTDVDGVRAALRLAAATGAAVDHAAATHIDVDLRVLADAGVMVTSPAETRHRADLIVLAGPGAVAWAAAAHLFDESHLYPWRNERKVLAIGVPPETLAEIPGGHDGVATFGSNPANLVKLIGLARARLAGRAIAAGLPEAEVDAAAAILGAARYGVIVYDGADLGALGTELIHGLVKDLNGATRYTTLPAPAGHGGRAANIVSAWTTGGPLRIGFGRGYPEFDPWKYEANRLVTSGEADAVVWVAPLGPDLPDWPGSRPTVALVAPGTTVAADVVVEVGVPGVHHGASLVDNLRDGFSYVEATTPADHPTAAAILGAIQSTLAGGTA